MEWSRRIVVLSTQYAVLWLAVANLMGCVQSVHVPGKPATSSPSTNIKLVQADGKGLSELIESHKGKVVLVDYWATWCGPCVEAFPHTVALAKKHREAGLVAIAVSFDQLDDQDKVREFLAKQGVDFDTLISKHDGVNQQ